MLADIASIYRTAWRFSLACPILFLIPVAVEMLQHVAEIHIGLYDSFERAEQVAEGNTRMSFGMAKIVALLFSGYWFIRYLGFGESASEARHFATRGFALWLVIFALQTAQAAYALFGPPLGDVLGLAGQFGQWFGAGAALVWTLFALYLAAWLVA